MFSFRQLSWVMLFGIAIISWPLHSLAAATDQPHDGGHVLGTVTAIDYRRGLVHLRTPQKRMMLIRVLPSTTVSSGDHDRDDYQALTDVHVGSHIEVDVSQRARLFEAQTIELDKP